MTYFGWSIIPLSFFVEAATKCLTLSPPNIPATKWLAENLKHSRPYASNEGILTYMAVSLSVYINKWINKTVYQMQTSWVRPGHQNSAVTFESCSHTSISHPSWTTKTHRSRSSIEPPSLPAAVLSILQNRNQHLKSEITTRSPGLTGLITSFLRRKHCKAFRNGLSPKTLQMMGFYCVCYRRLQWLPILNGGR